MPAIHADEVSVTAASDRACSVPLERPLTLLFAALAGLLGGLGLLATSFVAMGMDQVWLLYAAGRVMAGAPIYGAEVMESNPPFILWICAIPAWLGQSLHHSAAFGFRVCVVLLTMAILAWCCVLLRYLVTARRALLAWAFAAGLLGVTFYLASNGDAGEREHLMTLFMLPYLFAVALRLRQIRIPAIEAFALGVSAAIAVCCKPQHLLIIAGVELLLVIRRRSMRSLVRPEFAGIVVGGAAYLAAVTIFAPRYLHDVVPLLTQTYWAFGGIPLVKMFTQKRSLLLLLAILVCAGISYIFRRRLQAGGLLAALLTAAVGSLVAYWMQATGFGYQLIPASSFLVLAVVVLCADVTTALPPGSSPSRPPRAMAPLALWTAPVVAALFCAIALLGLQTRFRDRAAALRAVDPQSNALLSQYPAGTAVYWMALDPGFFPAAVEHHYVWASRFPHLWMVPAVVRTQQHEPNLKKHLTPEQVASLSAQQHSFMVEDLEHWHPSLVGVERCDDPALETCEGMNHAPVNLLQWFGTDPAFARAWSRYKFIETAGRYDFYRLQP